MQKNIQIKDITIFEAVLNTIKNDLNKVYVQKIKNLKFLKRVYELH